jgi:peptide/nickel transport system substrate-binding protein
VKRYVRSSSALVLAVIATLALAACGGSSSSSSSAGGSAATSSSTSASGGSGASGGTVNEVMGAAPQSLDPAKDYSTQGAEMNWIVYTGLTTYEHSQGKSSVTLIPGLATALPKITDGGLTYTATLRKGLKFSNGAPVKASDFAYAVERAIKLPWGGSGQFLTPIIVGGTAFSTGKAKSISGITTNDATGKIVIHLVKPYGPFDNVLAFPAVGLIPTGIPFKEEPQNPPPGVGPYKVTNIVPNQSWSMVKNPDWTPIPGIPSGHVNTNVKISANINSNVLSVVNNSADVMDWADVVPGSLLPQIKAKAADRYSNVNLGGSTYYLFMNVTQKPFSSQLAREAVATGLNQTAMNRLSSGTLESACYFLPPAVPGHPTAQSGMAGTAVTVWSDTRDPRQPWMQYYTSFLNSIGFKATLKVIADASYFTTIGERKLHPQTGFADWNQDFANPVDFYLLVDGNAILPTDNENYGEINDPKINSAITTLGKVPTTQIGSVEAKWQATDEYLAKKAYVVVFGYQTFPKLMSSRMNYSGALFNSVYGWDLTSFQIK